MTRPRPVRPGLEAAAAFAERLAEGVVLDPATEGMLAPYIVDHAHRARPLRPGHLAEDLALAWAAADDQNVYVKAGAFRLADLVYDHRRAGLGIAVKGWGAAALTTVLAVMADVDLAAVVAAEGSAAKATGPAWTKAKTTATADLHALPAPALERTLAHGVEVLDDAMRQLGLGPGDYDLVYSGYGLYPVIQLDPADVRRLDDAREAQRRLVAGLTAVAGYPLADPGAKDAGTRQFRLPGAWNVKAEGHAVQAALLRAGARRVPLDELLELLAPYAAVPSASPAEIPPAAALPPGADPAAALAPWWGSGSGVRHEQAWALGRVLAQRGLPEADAVGLVRRTAQLAGDPEYGTGDAVQARVAEAYRRFRAGEPGLGLRYLTGGGLAPEGVSVLLGVLDSIRPPSSTPVAPHVVAAPRPAPRPSFRRLSDEARAWGWEIMHSLPPGPAKALARALSCFRSARELRCDHHGQQGGRQTLPCGGTACAICTVRRGILIRRALRHLAAAGRPWPEFVVLAHIQGADPKEVGQALRRALGRGASWVRQAGTEATVVAAAPRHLEDLQALDPSAHLVPAAQAIEALLEAAMERPQALSAAVMAQDSDAVAVAAGAAHRRRWSSSRAGRLELPWPTAEDLQAAAHPDDDGPRGREVCQQVVYRPDDDGRPSRCGALLRAAYVHAVTGEPLPLDPHGWHGPSPADLVRAVERVETAVVPTAASP